MERIPTGVLFHLNSLKRQIEQFYWFSVEEASNSGHFVIHYVDFEKAKIVSYFRKFSGPFTNVHVDPRVLKRFY